MKRITITLEGDRLGSEQTIKSGVAIKFADELTPDNARDFLINLHEALEVVYRHETSRVENFLFHAGYRTQDLLPNSLSAADLAGDEYPND